MSELCNAFTFWGQPKAQTLYSHWLIPFFTTRMLINTSDSGVNNQTVKLSIIVLGRLCSAIFFSPLYFLCCQKWIIFFHGFLEVCRRYLWWDFVRSFLYCAYRETGKRRGEGEEKWQGVWRLLLALHLNDLVEALNRDPAAVTDGHKYSNKWEKWVGQLGKIASMGASKLKNYMRYAY